MVILPRYGLLFDFASSALAGHAGCGSDNVSNGGNDKDGCQRSVSVPAIFAMMVVIGMMT